MSRYAEGTEVSVEKSKSEIERTLMRYGADQFMSAWDKDKGVAIVGFRVGRRYVQIQLPMPDPRGEEFTKRKQISRSGNEYVYDRTEGEASRLWEQAQRQRWRALGLVIKAKLEAIDVGIATFDDEFLAYTMMPNGQTVGRWAQPQLEEAYATGKMPPMLPAFAEKPRRNS